MCAGTAEAGAKRCDSRTRLCERNEADSDKLRAAGHDCTAIVVRQGSGDVWRVVCGVKSTKDKHEALRSDLGLE